METSKRYVCQVQNTDLNWCNKGSKGYLTLEEAYEFLKKEYPTSVYRIVMKLFIKEVVFQKLYNG